MPLPARHSESWNGPTQGSGGVPLFAPQVTALASFQNWEGEGRMGIGMTGGIPETSLQ